MTRVLATAMLLAVLISPAAATARSVHLRGTAYEFNNTKVRLAGATIRVAERPGLRTTVKRDGSYDLVVPDRATITPYITASGHHTIHLQTFRTAGENLDRVNFQVPTDGVYRGLAALLDVPVDEAGELRDCAIVSTFSTRNVRDLSFEQFTAYGAHGVAGATATGSPALPAPVYFNDQVVPDPEQQRSSVDGGVVWTRVPAGVYTIRATSPATRFASFVATCEPGRVVNANPPWGLHELGKAMPAVAAADWSQTDGRVRLRSLGVTKLPPGARIRISCSGSDCPFAQRRVVAKAGRTSADLLGALGAAALRLETGQTLAVLVTAHAYDGRLFRWRLGSTPAARPLVSCVPLGNTKPRPRC